jgi:hypothetical protein
MERVPAYCDLWLEEGKRFIEKHPPFFEIVIYARALVLYFSPLEAPESINSHDFNRRLVVEYLSSHYGEIGFFSSAGLLSALLEPFIPEEVIRHEHDRYEEIMKSLEDVAPVMMNLWRSPDWNSWINN